MKLMRVPIALLSCVVICSAAAADDATLIQRVTDLESRISALEQLLEKVDTKDRWKDTILWQRIKQEMSSGDIQKLLGKSSRIEEKIFVTWYYHPTSKLHSYVWFDEGKVLGWEAPR